MTPLALYATELGLAIPVIVTAGLAAKAIVEFLRLPKPGLNSVDDAREWATQLRDAAALHAQGPALDFLAFLRLVRTNTVQLAIAMFPAPLTPMWLPGIGNTSRLAQVQGASRVREGWPGPQSPLASYPPGALDLLTPRATPVARVHFDDDEVESFSITTRPVLTRTAEFATVLVAQTPIFDELHTAWDAERRLAKAKLRRALKTPTQQMRAVFDAMTEDWLCSHCDDGEHDSCPGCSCPTCLQVVSRVG